jgi:hypothetical protein
VANVSERERWAYEPFPPDGAYTVNDLARDLAEKIGGDWRGHHTGTIKALPDLAVLVRVGENAAGRRVLTGLVLLGDAITADQLRKVPVSAIENSANLSVDDAYDKMRTELAKLPPLERSADTDPEEFSRLVAEHFKVWARYVPHPAAAMAAEWKVKAPTVHTWIREARLRGLLPAARRRKAG